MGILSASASKLVSILLARSEKMSSLPSENSETNPKSNTYADLNKIIEDLSSLTVAKQLSFQNNLRKNGV